MVIDHCRKQMAYGRICTETEEITYQQTEQNCGCEETSEMI